MDSLSSYLYAPEEYCVEELLNALPWEETRANAVQSRAHDLVQRIRAEKLPMGQLESFLQQYALTTDEGLALMCLAEALLRVPDKATANALIRDKIAAANWLSEAGSSKDWVVKAAGVGLLVTRRTLNSALSRVGQPFIREAMVKAMQILSHQFVLGETIEHAIKKAKDPIKAGYRMSYDILGEGARTADDAQRYFDDYAHAIEAIGDANKDNEGTPHGLSVKLSALHPRYEFSQAERCVPEMQDRLRALAELAAKHKIMLTVDAEEADRLALSLDIIKGVLDSPVCRNWDGFGMAVQAYQKRAHPLLDHIYAMAKERGVRLHVRVVKGAYWDSEIKHSQVESLPDFPVFTRKANTDLSFLACAHKLFGYQDHIYPMLATHNAHSVAAILEMVKGRDIRYEFQRLHGMGEALFTILRRDEGVPASIYAPVGPHRDLLPYLVRRLLENGANSSFVNKLLDSKVDIDEIVRDPVLKIKNDNQRRHKNIYMPHELYREEPPEGRVNSSGLDLADVETTTILLDKMRRFNGSYEAKPMIGGRVYDDGVSQDVHNPAALHDAVGRWWSAEPSHIDTAFESAKNGFQSWSALGGQKRADILQRAADLFEENREELMALTIREAGKTIPDALAEVREAVDFLRYYANRGRADFADEGLRLPGPTGESNRLYLKGRGAFVCISPWNFPLAIFTGQVAAALMAGNAVMAKPAEQSPLIAMRAVQLLYDAGVPENVLHFLPGDGHIGAALVEHPDVAGVAFTGSVEVAKRINLTLARKEGPIVPLIAETGGLNAMIVDSSALLEQVCDDVVLSAFGSAGQRCSALRILCLQEDIAEPFLKMLKGAMAELSIGHGGQLSTDIGPVIDEEARSNLKRHRDALQGFAKMIYEVPLDADLKQQGYYFPPSAWELLDLKGLEREVFGPILHVVRYKESERAQLVADLNAKGYGLTFGVHSRIESTQEGLCANMAVGNAYVNRSIIGAIVGTQPFGGQGFSGTGPKAGGPHYLPRFAHEQVISIDTTASGGNASLVSLKE